MRGPVADSLDSIQQPPEEYPGMITRGAVADSPGTPVNNPPEKYSGAMRTSCSSHVQLSTTSAHRKNTPA